MTFVRYTHTIKKGEIIPKTKKFGCVGRGDLTFLFFLKVVKYIEVRGDKSFTSRPSRPAKITHNSTSLVYF